MRVETCWLAHEFLPGSVDDSAHVLSSILGQGGPVLLILCLLLPETHLFLPDLELRTVRSVGGVRVHFLVSARTGNPGAWPCSPFRQVAKFSEGISFLSFISSIKLFCCHRWCCRCVKYPTFRCLLFSHLQDIPQNRRLCPVYRFKK